MRAAGLLIVLGACGFHVHELAFDAASDRPDAGMVDSDEDGIPDDMDNCPMLANSDQLDHDGDGHGDLCDRCPHLASAQDPDSDGDGLGDACDPRPNQAGDRRLLYVEFDDPSDIAGWPLVGTWSVAQGMLTGGAITIQTQYTRPSTIFQHAFAQTALHVNTMAMPSASISPGVFMYTGNAGSTQYYLCEARAAFGGNVVNARDVYPASQSQMSSAPWPGTLAPGSKLEITDAVLAATHACTVTQGLAALPVMQPAGTTSGAVVLGASYASVSYDYLFVVEIGG